MTFKWCYRREMYSLLVRGGVVVCFLAVLVDVNALTGGKESRDDAKKHQHDHFHKQHHHPPTPEKKSFISKDTNSKTKNPSPKAQHENNETFIARRNEQPAPVNESLHDSVNASNPKNQSDLVAQQELKLLNSSISKDGRLMGHQGTAGQQCVIPFIYDGITRYTCMDQEGDEEVGGKRSKQWCSLTSNYDRDTLWTFCPTKSSIMNSTQQNKTINDLAKNFMSNSTGDLTDPGSLPNTDGIDGVVAGSVPSVNDTHTKDVVYNVVRNKTDNTAKAKHEISRVILRSNSTKDSVHNVPGERSLEDAGVHEELIAPSKSIINGTRDLVFNLDLGNADILDSDVELPSRDLMNETFKNEQQDRNQTTESHSIGNKSEVKEADARFTTKGNSQENTKKNTSSGSLSNSKDLRHSINSSLAFSPSQLAHGNESLGSASEDPFPFLLEDEHAGIGKQMDTVDGKIAHNLSLPNAFTKDEGEKSENKKWTTTLKWKKLKGRDKQQPAILDGNTTKDGTESNGILPTGNEDVNILIVGGANNSLDFDAPSDGKSTVEIDHRSKDITLELPEDDKANDTKAALTSGGKANRTQLVLPFVDKSTKNITSSIPALQKMTGSNEGKMNKESISLLHPPEVKPIPLLVGKNKMNADLEEDDTMGANSSTLDYKTVKESVADPTLISAPSDFTTSSLGNSTGLNDNDVSAINSFTPDEENTEGGGDDIGTNVATTGGTDIGTDATIGYDAATASMFDNANIHTANMKPGLMNTSSVFTNPVSVLNDMEAQQSNETVNLGGPHWSFRFQPTNTTFISEVNEKALDKFAQNHLDKIISSSGLQGGTGGAGFGGGIGIRGRGTKTMGNFRGFGKIASNETLTGILNSSDTSYHRNGTPASSVNGEIDYTTLKAQNVNQTSAFDNGLNEPGHRGSKNKERDAEEKDPYRHVGSFQNVSHSATQKNETNSTGILDKAGQRANGSDTTNDTLVVALHLGAKNIDLTSSKILKNTSNAINEAISGKHINRNQSPAKILSNTTKAINEVINGKLTFLNQTHSNESRPAFGGSIKANASRTLAPFKHYKQYYYSDVSNDLQTMKMLSPKLSVASRLQNASVNGKFPVRDLQNASSAALLDNPVNTSPTLPLSGLNNTSEPINDLKSNSTPVSTLPSPLNTTAIIHNTSTPALGGTQYTAKQKYLPELTFGGNAKGAKCMFPFIYDGVTYYTCITADRDRPWCSTTSSYDKLPKWGYCVNPKAANNTSNPQERYERYNTAADAPHKEVFPPFYQARRTYGGNGGGKDCVFPFVYDGQIHMECISKRDGTSWCAVTRSYDVHPLWGKCCSGSEMRCGGRKRGHWD